jgi:ankyrin repeat protein
MACRDELGDTPLHYATRAGETDVVRYLLNRTKGIVTNLKNNHGQTSLHYAVIYKTPTVAILLVQYKGNPDGRDTLGQSPIKLANRSSAVVKEVFRELAGLPQPLTAEVCNVYVCVRALCWCVCMDGYVYICVVCVCVCVC